MNQPYYNGYGEQIEYPEAYFQAVAEDRYGYSSDSYYDDRY